MDDEFIALVDRQNLAHGDVEGLGASATNPIFNDVEKFWSWHGNGPAEQVLRLGWVLRLTSGLGCRGGVRLLEITSVFQDDLGILFLRRCRRSFRRFRGRLGPFGLTRSRRAAHSVFPAKGDC